MTTKLVNIQIKFCWNETVDAKETLLQETKSNRAALN